MNKISQNSASAIDRMNNIEKQIESIKGIIDEMYGMQIVNPDMQVGVTPEQKSKADLDTMNQVVQKQQDTMNQVSTLNASLQRLGSKLQMDMTRLTQSLQKAEQGKNMTTQNNTTANKKVFNLKKYSQNLEDNTLDSIPDLNDSMPDENFPKEETIKDEVGGFEENASEDLNFPTASELVKWMDSGERQEVEQNIRELVPTDKMEPISSLLKDYFETAKIDQDKLEIASQIWRELPEIVKPRESAVREDVIEAPYVQAFVKDIENSIKKQAQTDSANAKTKVFNMKRYAQAKTVENVIMWGPDQVRIDPFLRQPISDWHIVERNKGFGLVLDDVWNTDWEAIWRGTIMDKYSQPYRDKDGNWVGGYIQKRFEVDKWIPEENNIQLKPGQKRKPYLPEYRSLEARMEAARNKDEVSTSKGETFDWHTAENKSFNLKKFSEAKKKKLLK